MFSSAKYRIGKSYGKCGRHLVCLCPHRYRGSCASFPFFPPWSIQDETIFAALFRPKNHGLGSKINGRNFVILLIKTLHISKNTVFSSYFTHYFWTTTRLPVINFPIACLLSSSTLLFVTSSFASSAVATMICAFCVEGVSEHQRRTACTCEWF